LVLVLARWLLAVLAGVGLARARSSSAVGRCEPGSKLPGPV
jgi:hypothetical protein